LSPGGFDINIRMVVAIIAIVGAAVIALPVNYLKIIGCMFIGLSVLIGLVDLISVAIHDYKIRNKRNLK
jgi:hypothetical protein